MKRSLKTRRKAIYVGPRRRVESSARENTSYQGFESKSTFFVSRHRQQIVRREVSNTGKNYGRCDDTMTNKTLHLVQPYDISNSYTLQLVSTD